MTFIAFVAMQSRLPVSRRARISNKVHMRVLFAHSSPSSTKYDFPTDAFKAIKFAS